ncbi:MAG: cell wall-binding repeat-containing protein [Clostridia bacterium]|nr:cell wall-binding repeat-containing protein [Clostridia bacterium]
MKKGLFQSKAFSLLLIIALLLCMAPQTAFTAYADESIQFEVSADDCEVIGEYMGADLYYAVAPTGTTEVVFKDVEGNMEGGMIVGLQAGSVSETNVAPIAGDFRATWESMNTNDTITFEEGAEDLDYSNAYFYFVMDGDYDMASYVIQVSTPPVVITDFESNVGIKTGPVEDGYTYTAYVYDPENPAADPYGYVTQEAKADLYTLTVPCGTQEVTLDFGEAKTISYNYDENGVYLDGYYPDATIGESTTTKKVDSNSDGVPDYIWVQNPYNADYSGGELLYVIKLAYNYNFTVSVDGTEMTEMSFKPDNYSYYDYMTGATQTVGTFTVTIPRGTETVDLDFTDNVICYNYTKDGTYLGGYYSDFMTGSTEAHGVPVDYGDSTTPADGAIDYIQVQTPYDAAYNTTLLYTITFRYDGIPDEEDIDDVYEMLVQKAAKLMSVDANATYKVGDWFIFDQKRDGREVNPHYLQTVDDYFNLGVGTVGPVDYLSTDISKTILTLTALGYDPRTFADFDLFILQADKKQLDKQGLNAYIWALLAMDSHDYNLPVCEDVPEEDLATRDVLVDTIADAYIEDGGWAIIGTEPDVDITAMVIAALAPYYEENDEVHDKIDKAVKWLSDNQNEDGTFSAKYSGTTEPTAESTAMVAIALTSIGIDPATDERFVKNDNSVMSGLCSFAVLEGDNPGMKHILNGPVNTLATEQGYRAFVSYMRFVDEKFPIYDLLDQMILTRVYGKTRYQTSLEVAKRYMNNNSLMKLDSVIVATGDDFPDALSGSSLSIMKEAPVLLISNKVESSRLMATTFIEENLVEGGDIYIVGGNGAVSTEYSDSLEALGYKVTRYSGKSRYNTNLEILNALGESEYLLVCSGANYADAATASATGLPVLLAGTKLEDYQLDYLAEGKRQIYVIGGKGAVSEEIAEALAEYDTDGTVDRVAGKDRSLTAKAVAEEFFDLKPYVSTVVFAYGGNFPDCISGGLLAYSLNAPILYGGTHQSYTDADAPYIQENIVKTAYILGGPSLIPDEFVFGLDE